MGYRDDAEICVKAPYSDTSEIEFDVYNLRVGIDPDGHWRVYGLKDGDATELLDGGDMPRFYEWNEVG